MLTALWLPAATAAREDARGVQSAPELPAGVVQKHAKLDSALARVADTRPGAQLVRVEAVARGGRRAELERAISAAGGSTTGRYGRLVEARIPARALEALAAHPATRRLRTPTRPHPQVVSSQGVGSTKAADWHSAKTNGAGVEIAIVDVGFAGWRDRQAAGELPAQVVAVDLCSLFEFEGVGADDHGTAVAEIVHDVAPAAKLHLICIDDPTSLGEAKDYVVANDIPIVNHSVGWLNTSRGDGTGAAGSPDAIVADARAQGVLWVNAAGNYGELHWSGTFSDPDGDTYHNFAALDEGNDVFLYTDVFACVYLKWDAWPATDQDFDLLLFRSSDDPAVDDPVAWSTFIQDGSQEPYEELCYQDPGGLAGDYYVAIKSEGATKTPRFDLIVTDGEVLQHRAPAGGGVVEPATSPHAVAVGAVCVADGQLRAYSSRGPTIDGRAKPDLAGPDGVSTVTYEAAETCDAGFEGTSAATPHVAAAAALIKQANPSFGPAELQTALESRTGPPEGKNNELGAGSLLLGGAPPFPPSAPANTALPAIVGFFNQGQTLTASDGEWSSGAALFLAYRWLRCNAGGAACVPIAGARGKTYVPTAADVDLVLKVRVTGSNGGGSAQALSAGTPQIQSSLQPPANVLAPSLAGSAQFGQTMSASSGGWSGSAPLTITVEWLRCNAEGEACAVIAGADAASYQLALEDIGMTIRVRATATNPAGAATASSPASATVLPPPPGLVAPPAIAGAPVEGQMLTASAGTWTFASALLIQWRRCAAEGACADIPGATSATYAPGINDAGLRLQVAVTASNPGGTSSAASTLTSPVARVVVHSVPAPNPRPEPVAPQTRLVVLGLTRSPHTPQAGRRFALVVRVGTRATSARGAARRVSCSANIGRKGLRPVAKSIRGGAARCVWAIPKSAAGKRLRTTIVVSEGARSVRKTVTTRIRGARLG